MMVLPPESDEAMKVPLINEEYCNMCQNCINECPQGVLEIIKDKIRITNPAECDYCGTCENICSTGAITCPVEIIVKEE